MNNNNDNKKIYPKPIFIGLLAVFFCFFYYDVKTETEKRYDTFETRLQFYVDLKTKRFLKKMTVRETFLMQMIYNITQEIKSRGKEKSVDEEIGFSLIYDESNKLLMSYSKEIDAILNIIKELENLEAFVKRSDDLKLLDELNHVKDNLSNALNDRKLTHGQVTRQQAATMINEYSKEVNSLLKLYEETEIFEKKAAAIGDNEIVKRLQEQKRRIVQTLELSRLANPVEDKAVEEYIDETANMVTILKELDQLELKVQNDTLLMHSNIDSVRNKLLTNIDERIYKLFGYTTDARIEKTTLSEYFKEWKARKIAEFQAKLTKYRIVRNQLIKSADSYERNRMLENEINNALLNYTEQNYELAIMQFNEIYNVYSPFFEKLDGVIFYCSEANYESGYFDAALEGFNRVINGYPNSQYVNKAYLRCMLIFNSYNWNEKFFEYFDQFQKLSNVESADFYEANYIAGYLNFNLGKFIESRKNLESVQEESDYYFAAQYLLGTVYVNIDNYVKAKQVFEDLVNRKNYPWTDLNAAIIRNEALLKLGYLHYQRGEYENAILYFEKVSKGYEGYDASLMGQAWAKMKKGEYDESINKINSVTNNYLLSKYTYEALVLSAHCKKIQDKDDEALKDLRYVSDSKEVLQKTKDYNEERKRIINQLDELSRLEEQILERQDRKLYPKVMQIREMINNVLTSFYYRGSISSRIVEEYNDERKILLRQIQEFENIMSLSEAENNKQMYNDAQEQRNRLLSVLESYESNATFMNSNYFVNYPMALKEGSTIYRFDIVKKTVDELIEEKKRLKTDLDIITKLMAANNAETQIDVVLDLEILEEDMRDLHNQLNRFQLWLANNQVTEIESNADHWADFSGFGISDINFTTYYEQIQKINSLNKNISYVEEILKNKKDFLEKKIAKYDTEVMKIQKEMEAEKVRLEKLEKEKYFRDIYFDTKTREIEQAAEDVESIFE